MKGRAVAPPEIVLAVQEIPDMLDKLRTDHKVPLHIGIDNEIHIPLAVAQLPVLQAVELLRQRQQGLGEQSNALGPDAHLAPLGAEHLAVHAHDVADVVLLKLLVDRLIHLVLTGIELDTAVPVLQVAEADLAHAALAHQAAGHPDGLAFHLVKVLLGLGGRGGIVKVRLLEGILPGSLTLRCSLRSISGCWFVFSSAMSVLLSVQSSSPYTRWRPGALPP